MRYLSLLLLFLTPFCNAQINQTEAEAIAKKHFEEVYVQESFKDPYSYELKKMWSEVQNNEDNYLYRIKILKELSLDKRNDRKSRKKLADSAKEWEEMLNNFSESEKLDVAFYYVYIDAHGANSYGNLVLGRYIVTVNPQGEVTYVSKKER